MRFREKIYFTLIELLVVITIIAILASMLLPALRNAKNMTTKIQCAGNMKTAYSAFSLYGEDYDRYITAYANHYDYSSFSYLWMPHMAHLGIVYPPMRSVKGMARFMCPSIPIEKYNNTDRGWDCWGLNYYRVFSWIPSGGDWSGIRNFRKIQKPSQTLFMAEVADTANPTTTKYGYYLSCDPDINTTRARITARHGNKTSTVLFFDGHLNTAFKPFDAPKNYESTFWCGK